MSAYKDAKTGKWYTKFRYRTYDGTNKQVKKMGFTTKHEAKQYEQEYIARMTGSQEIKFFSLADEYLHDLAKRVKPTTLESVTNKVNYLKQTLGDRDVQKIKPIDYKHLYGKMMEKYRSGSARNIKNILHQIMDYGRKYYGLEAPYQAMEAAGQLRYNDQKPPRKDNYWTLAEFNDFIGKITDDEIRLQLELLFWSGCRRGEILGLRIMDIDGNTIRIRQNNTTCGITSPKTATSVRDIGIPEWLAEKLKDYIKQRHYQPNETDLIFATKPLYLTNNFCAAQRWLNIQHRITLHGLRHSHASLLIRMGVDQWAIAKRLGHANPTMIQQIYGKPYQASMDEISIKLESLYESKDALLKKAND